MVKPLDRLGLGPTYVETQVNDGWCITVTPPDWAGGGPSATVHLTPAQYSRYRQWRERGILIQKALPELTTEQREILMTGWILKRFKEYIGGDDDAD